MKSHICEFIPRDLLRIIGWPLIPLGVFSLALHLTARGNLLPAPRPTLDTDRTILVHQAEAARRSDPAEVLLLGDSSCLMDVSARELGERIGRPALSLATFSYLDLNAHAAMLREFARSNPGRPRAVVLLMNPESLRRPASDPYYLGVLTNFWAGHDDRPPATVGGQFTWGLGAEIFQGRLRARMLPVPLSGAYGRRYGFTRNLEDFLARERGSAIDPETQPFSGSAEYRLAPPLERASRSFKAAVPSGAKLLVAITPLPARFAGPRHPQVHSNLLAQWSQWLEADAALHDLPATLPDDAFVRTTHLDESMVPEYTARLADALRPHLP
jgi:hypothetical protein